MHREGHTNTASGQRSAMLCHAVVTQSCGIRKAPPNSCIIGSIRLIPSFGNKNGEVGTFSVRKKYSRTLDCEQLGLRVFYKTSKNFEEILT
jgi:hypothetical protein